MTYRSRPIYRARPTLESALSRRDVLRMGTTIIPAGLILPAWLTAQAATAPSTFDFYISPNGSDSNSGSLTDPWAITSLRTASPNFSKLGGKRIALLPGTYNVSGLMQNSAVVGALQIPGGSPSSPTYLASADANGAYSPRTATLNAKTASGIYGGAISKGAGSWDGPVVGHMGRYPSSYPTSNLVIDGLVITGFSYKAIRIGASSSADGPSGITNVTVQNCEIFGGNCDANPIDNCAAIWIDGCVGAVVTNNYIHDNVGPTGNSGDHLNAVIVWGPSDSSTTSGTVIQYNTCVNAGDIYGKEGGIQGTTVQNNYVDVSMYSINNSVSGIQDFTGAKTSGLSQTTTIRNNIILTGDWAIGRPTLSDSYGYSTPVICNNNTIVASSPQAFTALWLTMEPAGQGKLKCYNNIYTGTPENGGFGAFLLNPGGPSVWDYNFCIATKMSWTLRTDANLLNSIGTYTSQSAFASAMAAHGGISGAESHSIANDTPGFVGSGKFAAAYQLTGTSPAKGKGSTNGTPSGAATDIGAWGNGATQIGCNFAGGAAGGATVPMAPSLTVS